MSMLDPADVQEFAELSDVWKCLEKLPAASASVTLPENDIQKWIEKLQEQRSILLGVEERDAKCKTANRLMVEVDKRIEEYKALILRKRKLEQQIKHNTSDTEVPEDKPSNGHKRDESTDGERVEKVRVGIAKAEEAKKSPEEAKKSDKSIGEAHPEFELTYDMMLGIRTTVGKTEARPQTKLKSKDMTTTNRIRFPQKGSTSTPAHGMADFYFKDYAPEVFRRVRSRFGILPDEYMLNVCGNFEFLEFVSNSKSGEFFFFSYNQQYMIKTISHHEAKLLFKMLPAYYEHIMKFPDTLLPRFYGLHKVRPRNQSRAVYFLIMASVFYGGLEIHRKYDLKGSSQGREATAKEKQSKNPVLKDNDFLAMKCKLHLSPEQAQKLNQQIQEDLKVLRKMKIMDYSMLVGISYDDGFRPFDWSKAEYPTNSKGKKSAADEDDKHHARRDSVRMADLQDKTFKKRFSEDTGGSRKNLHRGEAGAEEDMEPEISGDSEEEKTNGHNAEAHVEVAENHQTNIFSNDHGGFRGVGPVGSKEVYFLGIIDILIEYGMKKKFETKFKSLTYDVNTISSVDQDKYADRFIDFMAKGVHVVEHHSTHNHKPHGR